MSERSPHSAQPRLNRSHLLSQLETEIGYRFTNRRLLSEAFIHKSYAAVSSRPGIPDNQRLEFFGDAVLGFFISNWLLELFPESNEGELSRRKASLIDTATLAGLGRKLDLGRYLLLSFGEEKTGGRSKKSVLAAAFEALLGAIYLDGGSSCTETFLKQIYQPILTSETNRDTCQDHKTKLQELAHSLGFMQPFYFLDKITGPDHNLCFSVTVMMGNECFAQGVGKTRKEAEQHAAREGIALLEDIAARKATVS